MLRSFFPRQNIILFVFYFQLRFLFVFCNFGLVQITRTKFILIKETIFCYNIKNKLNIAFI